MKISYIFNIYNRYLRNDTQSMFSKREKSRIGTTVLATFLINVFFLVSYVNIQPSCSETRMEYCNVKLIFDYLITLIGFCCIANLAILTAKENK